MGVTLQSLLKIASFLSVLQLTQACKIIVYNGSINNYVTFACDNTAQICSSGLLNVSLHSIIIFHGYGTDPDRPGPRGIANAVIENGQSNCLSADWSPENGYVIPFDFYFVTAQAVEQFTEALINMRDCLPPELLHLYGISIGAQIACALAKAYGQYLKRQVYEIVGCDPSKMKGAFPNCDSTCASQVIMLDTDWYHYGTDCPSGSTIIWFNGDTYEQSCHQPGCPVPYPDYCWNLSDYNVCCHQRAAFYLIYIIKYIGTCLFVATKAASMADWVAGHGILVICLDRINNTCTGQYFISTSAYPPYGLGQQGAKAVTQPKSQTFIGSL